MSESQVNAVILAAGLGKRLGLGPKAWVRLDGKTLLERAAETLQSAGVRRIVAVLPPGFDFPSPPCFTLHNPCIDTGPYGSLHLGLKQLDPLTGPLLMMPVDHPLVLPQTIETLIAQSMNGSLPETPYISPTYQGTAGHPVLLQENALKVLRKTPPSDSVTLRHVLQESGEGLLCPVDDPGILFNVNHPEDLADAKEQLKDS